MRVIKIQAVQKKKNGKENIFPLPLQAHLEIETMSRCVSFQQAAHPIIGSRKAGMGPALFTAVFLVGAR